MITPESWFLVDPVDSQNNIHVIPFTEGNEVIPLIDGARYMYELSNKIEDFESLTTKKYMYLSGWRITPNVSLLGDINNVPLLHVLDRAISSGIKLRFLLWMVPATGIDFIPTHGEENLEVAEFLDKNGADVLLDTRLPDGNFASHHQKFVVLHSEGSSTAFLGGIDLALDRWDTQEHNSVQERQPEYMAGWHDIQAQIKGPAITQIWDTFTNRWNDPRLAHESNLVHIGQEAPPIDPNEKPVNLQSNGSQYVQLLHTYACETSNNGNYPFAPSGDYSYEAGLIKAIKSAKHFIYIEDQYLWPCNVVDALADVLRTKKITLIIVVTHASDAPGLAPYHNYMQQVSLDTLTNIDGSGSIEGVVRMYHLQQENDGNDIYVHSKTMIIDDTYAVIGSANINKRSMRTDSEIGIAIVDAKTVDIKIAGQDVEVCEFAHRYRMELWKEHLGSNIDIEDPLNINLTPKGWPNSSGEQIHHAVWHDIPEEQFCAPSLIINNFMNAETSC